MPSKLRIQSFKADSFTWMFSMMFIGTALLCLFVLTQGCPCAYAADTSRAMRMVKPMEIRNAAGKKVGLYRESHALVIGVSQYDSGWPNLPGVKKDVEAVKTLLEELGFAVRVVVDPDRAKLLAAYERFIRDYGLDEDNRLLFYFAGHGHTITYPDGREMGYVVPANAPDPNADQRGFMAEALDMQQFEVYAKRIVSKHALFLFDSCFSGSIFSLSRSIPEVIQAKTSLPTRQFITAGTANQTVPDESIFRAQLVRGLKGEGDMNKDGYVTATELGQFLENTVTNYSKRSQTPKYGKIRDPILDQGDFVFPLKGGSPKETATKAGAFSSGGNAERQELEAMKRALDEERRRLEQEKMKMARLEPAPPAKKQQAASRNPCPKNMVFIPEGEFMAGYDDGAQDESPAHPLVIASFCLDQYEVTQGQFQEVMQFNPSRVKNRRLPVGNVTWLEAQAYCQALGKRLPLEMEWEKAARAGLEIPFYGKGKKSDDYAWSSHNAGNKPHPVGGKKASPLGLYDMAGNMAEWVFDWYGPDLYRGDHQENLEGPFEGAKKVLRGGSWVSYPKELRLSRRQAFGPNYRHATHGFRCAQ